VRSSAIFASFHPLDKRDLPKSTGRARVEPWIRKPEAAPAAGVLSAPIGDAAGLAAALAKVLGDRDRYVRPRAEIAARFDLATTAAFYERLYATVQAEVAAERGGAPLGAQGA
jgi:hypothetical protein